MNEQYTCNSSLNIPISITNDFHLHIGQFYQHYYSPKNVINAVAQCGVKKIIFSNTSAGFTINNQKDAQELHNFVNAEVSDALEWCKKLNIDSSAYLWVVPEFWNYKFTLENDLQTGLYKGLKLHTRTFFDRYNNVEEQNKIIQTTFEVAQKNNLPILIHTGVSENLDEPKRFESFLEKFQDVKVTLAHCKDYQTCIKYFARYKNVFGDTAFCPEDAIDSIKKAGFKNRMYIGTDFPITHYFNHREESAINDVCLEDLVEQYKKDIGKLNNFLV